MHNTHGHRQVNHPKAVGEAVAKTPRKTDEPQRDTTRTAGTNPSCLFLQCLRHKISKCTTSKENIPWANAKQHAFPEDGFCSTHHTYTRTSKLIVFHTLDTTNHHGPYSLSPLETEHNNLPQHSPLHQIARSNMACLYRCVAHISLFNQRQKETTLALFAPRKIWPRARHSRARQRPGMHASTLQDIEVYTQLNREYPSTSKNQN